MQMKFKCKEVWVKFKDRNLQGERITHNDYSGAEYMHVECDDLFLTIVFVHNDVPLKIITFATESVLEFSLENGLARVGE